MSHLKPIIITPRQIIAVAALIAADQTDEYTAQYTPEQWQTATEHWLRAKMNDILVDVDWHARNGFEIEPKCVAGGCQQTPLPHGAYCKYHGEYALEDGDTGRTVPLAPTVVHRASESDRATAPFANRPDLKLDAHGEPNWA